MPFAPDAVTFRPAIPYSWQVSRIRTGRLIEQPKRRFAYENHNENQDLPADGGDDSDGGACHPGGGTDTSTLQGYVPRDMTPPATSHASLHNRTGIGTHLGQFSFYRSYVNRERPDTGSAHWIAANGDSIDTTYVGSAEHVDLAPCQVVGAQPEDSYARSRKFTPLLVARVDSPEPKGALP